MKIIFISKVIYVKSWKNILIADLSMYEFIKVFTILNICTHILDTGSGQSMEELHAGPCKASTSSQIWYFDAYHNNV